MNKKINRWASAAAVSLLAVATVACSDWTDAESEWIPEYENTEAARPETYYKALREWKKSDHSISFGWFSEWGEPGVSTANMLAGIPDSMDMISLWNNSTNLSAGKLADLREVQQKKGTRVLICTFIQYIGRGFTPEMYDTDEATREAFWGWVDGDEEAIKTSMHKYAQAIQDTIVKYGYDGLDIDFEPNVDGVPSKLDENSTYVGWFLDILKDYLGPKSTSGKMLVLDGELWAIPPHTAPYFDYFIAQAYSVSGGTPSPTAGTSESDMESRLNRIVGVYRDHLTEEQVTNRFIVTENMESALDALNGGFYWTMRDGVRQDKSKCPSLVGMARWQPINGFRKGGFGAYRFSNEAVNKPSYKWMRTGIQAQNPAVN